jgi:uncharacterized membrane protein YGL010W
MSKIDALLTEYGVSHQNATNKLIHWICVPLIFFSIVGLLYSIQLPVKITETLNLNVAMILLVLAIGYYVMLSVSLAIGMLLFSVACMAACYGIQMAGLPLWLVSITIFVLAWIAQFYGHHIEGKKPSFLKDLQFLLIGPAWIMSFVYRKAGIAL